MVFFIALPVITAAYLLMLRCRRGHPGWEELRPFRYAHRGLHGNGCPENSMAAFRKAIEYGYGMELDVHLLADGSLAVIHDSTLGRTTGQEGVVEDLTASELGNFRLEGTEETIPLFSRVLEEVRGRVPLIIELKSTQGNYAALTDAACRMLEEYEGTYCIESFDPRCVRRLKKRYPRVVRGQLAGNFLAGKGSFPRFLLWMLTCQLANFLTVPDFVAYRFRDRKRLGVYLVRKLWGAQGVAWTITSREECGQAEAEGFLPIFEGFCP